MLNKDYFKPVTINSHNKLFSNRSDSLLHFTNIYTDEDKFPSLQNIKVAIIGVEEHRASLNNDGVKSAADNIRDYFYELKEFNVPVQLADLGNLISGNTTDDTYFALADVCTSLIKDNIIPIVIGGSQDVTFGQYKAFENLKQIINLVSVDSRFDLGEPEEPLHANSFLGKIILQQPNYLFNFSNVGYQTYFVGSSAIELMNKMYFDAYRLGELKGNLKEVEPIVRNADLMSFDISAIQQSDAPGNANASPNGFTGVEACQIMRYAGLSDKISALGIHEYNPMIDVNGQTAHLIAQMLWYFIDGIVNRKKESPFGSKNSFIKYRVPLAKEDHEIVFIKSKKSERWWMEVPVDESKIKLSRHHIVPCSYTDYETACNNEMPDRWWQAFKKLSS
ncbi:MAG: formimidoylglutamase [Bacteroidia bacterium]|nr:formimidoylglutamase [Bacteroidia bacterium]